jgi:hypothetical protein
VADGAEGRGLEADGWWGWVVQRLVADNDVALQRRWVPATSDGQHWSTLIMAITETLNNGYFMR